MTGRLDAPGPARMPPPFPPADAMAAQRAALRLRQGGGARYDAAAAPARDLRCARLGTAYFARQLNGLDDDALWARSSRPGWSRRRVIAAVGLAGRAMAQAIGRAIGVACEDFADVDGEALDLAETLPAGALRHLVAHAAIHLDVTWRDLTDAQWDLPLADAPSATARDTVLTRARMLWTGALDLRSGGRPSDVPADVRAALEG